MWPLWWTTPCLMWSFLQASMEIPLWSTCIERLPLKLVQRLTFPVISELKQLFITGVDFSLPLSCQSDLMGKHWNHAFSYACNCHCSCIIAIHAMPHRCTCKFESSSAASQWLPSNCLQVRGLVKTGHPVETHITEIVFASCRVNSDPQGKK